MGMVAEKPDMSLLTIQEQLRQLARSQRADGSWGGDSEQTAAVLLAFIRAGETTRSGSFRAALRKALRWLKEQNLSGLSAYLRARVLDELSNATSDQGDIRATWEARDALPTPGNALEEACLNLTGQSPHEIKTLEDLRLAALLRARLPVPQMMLMGKDADLARAWAAAIG